MPTKGRSHPCDDPMKKGHKKQSQYKDVLPVSDQFLNQLRDGLPEFKWKDGTRMCGTCRSKATYKMKLRRDALHLAQGGSGLAAIIQEAGETEVPTAGPSQASPDIPGIGFPERHMTSTQSTSPIPEHTETIYPVLPSAPPIDTLSAPHNIAGQSQISSGDNSGAMITPTPSPVRQQVQSPSGDIDFVTPTRTPCDTTVRQNTIVPSSAASTPSSSILPSPSIVASNITTASQESGSVFHDEQTAKIELNQLLKSLGVRGSEKINKYKPRKLFKLMTEGMDKFRKLCEDYAGRKLPEDSLECNCKHCKLIAAAVKAKLPNTKSRKEMYMLLTSLPLFITIKQMHEIFGVTKYMARQASKLRGSDGPFSYPDFKPTGKPLSENVKQMVADFYLSNDNSRVNTTARECVYVLNEETGKKEKAAKQTMMCNLKDAFLEFKNTHEGVQIGISKFAELRPKNVRWPGQKGQHISCVCPIHENFRLMLLGLKNASIDALEEEFETDPTAAFKINLFDDYKEFIKYFICDPPTEDCYFGLCEVCPLEVQWEEVFKYSSGNTIIYNYWVKNDITTRVEEHAVFEEKFRIEFAKFLTHEFIYQQQKEFIKALKSGSLENGTSCVLTADFGENYTFFVQNAVQAFHWNNKQSTIHPFCLYASTGEGVSQYKTYFVISDDLCHDATAFHVFRIRVIDRIKEQFPNIRNIDYVSDGAGSQYKNRFNIANLLFHNEDFNLTARWIYTATGHGKSTCDALSSVVKRTIRLRSLSAEQPIITSQKMYEVATEELSSARLEFIYVTRDDVGYYRESLQQRYMRVQTIPGTQQFHFLSVLDGQKLQAKRYAYSVNSQTLEVIEPLPEEAPERMEIDFENSTEVSLPIIGEFYAISYGKTYQIGRAVEIFPERKCAKFMMMKKVRQAGIGLNWPLTEKFQEFEFSKILLKLSPPYYDDPKKNYRLEEHDITAIHNAGF